MADLTAKTRDSLPDSAFAVPGKRKLPVEDETHARLAETQVGRTQGLSSAERATAKKRIDAALDNDETEDTTKSMSTPSERDLEKAHSDVDTQMHDDERGTIQKALAGLRAWAGFGASEELVKGDPDSEPMARAGDSQYPNDQGAEKRLKRARAQSKPGQTDQYEGVEDADDDSVEYENMEPDFLKTGAKKSLAPSDVYDELVKASGEELVQEINATPALEAMASSFAKSLSDVSDIEGDHYEAVMAGQQMLAKGLVAVIGMVEELAKSVKEMPAPKDAPATEDETPAAEEATEKSQSQKDREFTLDFLEKSFQNTNAPAYLTAHSTLAKGQSATEDIDGPGGKQRLADALEKSLSAGTIEIAFGASLLSDMDHLKPSDVLKRIPASQRASLGLSA